MLTKNFMGRSDVKLGREIFFFFSLVKYMYPVFGYTFREKTAFFIN